MGTSAAFFDLDRTILARSSTLAFGRPFRDNGLINRRTALKAGYAQLVYLAVGADGGQLDRLRDRVSALCAGWEVDLVRGIVRESLHEIVDPLVYVEAASLIRRHRAEGHDVIIVSSSGQDVVEPIGEMLGVDQVIATRMVVTAGRYTGEIEFYAYGENKASAVRELAAARGYDLSGCYAYSDSATDLPLLESVGHPNAVNPDRALRRLAASRGWPVLTFARPHPARSDQRPHPVAPAVPAPIAQPLATAIAATPDPRVPPGLLAALALGVLAGTAWYATRRLVGKRRPHGARLLPDLPNLPGLRGSGLLCGADGPTVHSQPTRRRGPADSGDGTPGDARRNHRAGPFPTGRIGVQRQYGRGAVRATARWASTPGTDPGHPRATSRGRHVGAVRDADRARRVQVHAW